METRCPACSTVIPHTARYCPKCGAPAPADGPGPSFAPDAVPATATIPRTGKVVLLAGLLALVLIIAGFATRNPPLIYTGAAALGVLAVTITVGDIFS